MSKVFIGQIIHTKGFDKFIVIPNGFIAIKDGKIFAVGDDFFAWKNLGYSIEKEIFLSSSQFLMPGFIDCHIHAPQMPNIGIGLDKPLLEWLEKYTFPLEARYEDIDYAKMIYNKVVKYTISNGTTLAAYFATNHKESSLILAKECLIQGQRAFVGKVSSDKNSPNYYVENCKESIQDNIHFIHKVLNLNSELVKPIITPRFAISCSEELQRQLAHIAHKYDLNIQSHISENIAEIEIVNKMYNKLYAQTYADNNLLTKKTIMAHAVHIENEEINILKNAGTSIAHCPTSNTMLGSGLCDVKRLLESGLKVGLGTDVAGGHKASILNVIVHALSVSQHIASIKNVELKGTGKIEAFNKKSTYIPLNYKQAIYLATLGGAEALSVDNKIGNFEIGKDFDALIIETNKFPIQIYENDNAKNDTERLLELVQKFIYVGDDRNILEVYVSGKQIK